MGHARALVGVKDAALCLMLARRAVRSGLSVRAVEQLSQGPRRKTSRSRRIDPELQPFEDRLRRRFATQVRILRRGHRGRLEIEFYNQDDLERILEELNVLSDR
jgi:ParB family chromosome partitioning protein